MAKFRIEFNREECIGCGACASVCPDNWEMEQSPEYKANAKQTELDEIGCNKGAADICPVQVIKIIEE